MSRLTVPDIIEIVRGWLGEEMPKTWTNEQIVSYLNMVLVDLSSYDILRRKIEYTMPATTNIITLPDNVAMLWQITYGDYVYALISSTREPFISDNSRYAVIDTYTWEAYLSEDIEQGETVYLHATIYHPTVDEQQNTEILFEDKYNSLILFYTAMLCLFQTDDMYQKFFAFYEEQKAMLGLRNKIGDRINIVRELRSGKYK